MLVKSPFTLLSLSLSFCVLVGASVAEAQYPWQGKQRASTNRPSGHNWRQIHQSGRNRVYQNWGSIKSNATRADRTLGPAGKVIGGRVGSTAGPAAGWAGGVVGRHSPEAVIGLSQTGKHYLRGAGREFSRQFKADSRYRSRTPHRR